VHSHKTKHHPKTVHSPINQQCIVTTMTDELVSVRILSTRSADYML